MKIQHAASPCLHSSITRGIGCLLAALALSGCDQSVEADEFRTGACTPAVPQMVGHWTFEPGVEHIDLTGHFDRLELFGDASISGGQLHVHGANRVASGWANAAGDLDTPLRAKTLVSWIALDDLGSESGSALTIDGMTGDNFDGIVYAEQADKRWMAGSNSYTRTQSAVTTDETALGQAVQVAISYEDLGGDQVKITLCRQGLPLGQYQSGSMAEWSGAAEVFFGARHGDANAPVGALEARIEEARIYDQAMSCAEVGALSPNKSVLCADNAGSTAVLTTPGNSLTYAAGGWGPRPEDSYIFDTDTQTAYTVGDLEMCDTEDCEMFSSIYACDQDTGAKQDDVPSEGMAGHTIVFFDDWNGLRRYRDGAQPLCDDA